MVPDATLDGVRDVAGPSTETATTHPGKIDNQQQIALIKPCGHVLHDECLREWSQKANSCPICRHTFNLVEVLDKIGGPVVSEYAVEDKKQVADFDPNAWIEDNLEEEETNPCPICGESDREDILLLCDSCDAPYHTTCVGLDRVPNGHWFCMECAEDGAYARAAEPMHAVRAPDSGRYRPRTQASVRRTRRRVRTDWYGAWSMFSSRVHNAVGLDLDFEDDDEHMAGYRIHQRRTEEERREFQNWERRLNIAGRQGAREIFRNAAPILRDQRPQTPPETSDEARAWGAFEKAKEVDTTATASATATTPRGRKRRKSTSATASPSTPAPESSKEPERKLKRPRTRRVLDDAPSSSASRSISNSTAISNNRTGSPPRPYIDTSGEPSFLSTLLREVETATSDDDTTRSMFSAAVPGPNRVTSPSIEYSSPGASPSPTSSTYHTPRAMSITPPPHITKRPGSPLPLSSRVDPIFAPAEYSPSRAPPEEKHKPDQEQTTHPALELRQPRPRRHGPAQLPRSQGTSPARASMSIEAKEGISKIVKSALAPHWKSAEITKEQYADINRDVSRKLYDIVADCSRPNEQEKWEKIATHEVASAVKSLMA